MDELAHLHQFGVFLRHEALDHGWTDRHIRAALRDGVLHRIRHGAYVELQTWRTADARQRHLMLARAVLLTHGGAPCLSHTSAVVAHGIDTYRADLSKVHLSAMHGMRGRTVRDVVYHDADLPTGDRTRVAGFDSTVPARAVLEGALLQDRAGGLVMMNSGLHRGLFELDELWRRFDLAMRRWPGTGRLQVVVRLARPGAESVGETLSFDLMHRFGIPEPVLQYEVFDAWGRFVGRCDFAWPGFGVLAEFDGRIKYGAAMRRPDQTVEDVVLEEKRREDALREATGWLMIRLVWDDLARPRETADRLKDQLERGRRLIPV